MKFLFDLLPVILFFTAFKVAGKDPEAAAGLLASLLGLTVSDVKHAPILLATVVVILATMAQIAWVRWRHGKVDKMLWFSLALVVVFGGMTLAFQDESFIKWKPTILYWAFAAGLLISAVFFGKNAIRGVLGEQLQLPETVWKKLNMAWAIFFLFMGAANLYIAYRFSTDIWVDFKLFGGMGLMLVFIVAQGFFLAKYMEEPK